MNPAAPGMIGGPCHRCVGASPVEGIGGQWCRHQNGPATGNGCSWFRCVARCPMPDGNGTLCRETFALLPAGPCRTDCGYHAGREGRRC